MTEWLSRVNRLSEVQGRVNKHWKICSEHFEPSLIEKTLAGRRRLKKGAVPTIFDQGDIKRRRLCVEDYRQKLLAAEIAFMNGESIPTDLTRERMNEATETPMEVEKLNGIRRVLKELKQAKKSHESIISDSETSSSDQRNATSTNISPYSFPSIPSEKEYYEITLNSLRLENERLQREVNSEREFRSEIEKERYKLFMENAELKKGLEDEKSLRKDLDEELKKEVQKCTKLEQELDSVSFNYKSLSKNSKLMHYYSGFNAEEFELFIDFLGRDACEYLSFEDPSKNLNAEEGGIARRRTLCGRPRSMKPKDQLLMSLCRIRLGFTCQDLGVRFQTSIAQVARISNAFIALMQKRLKDAEVWPENDNTHIHNNQWPEVLKPFHQRVRVVIESLKTHVKKMAVKFPQHPSMVANSCTTNYNS